MIRKDISTIVGQTSKSCITLGDVCRKGGDKEDAIYCYEKAVEIAHKQKDHVCETEALRLLGRTYREAGENEKAIACYEKALPKTGNKQQEAEVFLGLAHVYEGNGQHKIAIEKYTKAEEIAKKHNCKWEETEACRSLGKVYSDLGDIKTAQKYFHKALDIAPKESYKPLIYLGLAHTYRSNGEYEKAIESYKEAEKMLTQESERVFEEMSIYQGLGHCLKQIGRIKEGEEYLEKAEKTAEKKWDILPAVLRVMNHPKLCDNTTIDHTPKKEVNIKEEENIKDEEEEENVKEEDNIEEQENVKEEKSYQQPTFGSEDSGPKDHSSLAEEFSDDKIPDSTSLVPEDVYHNHDKFVEKTPPAKVLVKTIPDVYTYQASIEEGLTEEIKIKMAEDVKRSAHMNLLNENDGKFSGDDRPIYIMAKNCVCKNDPTNRPGRLSNLLSRLNRSIGRISCGRAQGTCFIVAENFVITCYHVYSDFIEERKKPNQHELPIQVAFDYYEQEKLDNAVVVEVDESQQPNYFSIEFDYIILCLKQSSNPRSNLEDRERLGKFVRGYYLYEGLVCITGFPENRELREETCVVVQSDSKERLKKRQRQFVSGIHMASIDTFFSQNPHHAAYDTSLYRGSSGSPGFDMNGKIVVLHAQGYILDVGGKKHSLMEFGVNFGAICVDLERRFHIANQFFPNWTLLDDAGLIDVDEDRSNLNEL